MLPPEVEARFRKIEDDLTVTAQLQRRAELRHKDDIELLRSVLNAMLRWQEDYSSRFNTLLDAQVQTQETLAELSRTVDRFLEARTDGGGG